MTGVRHPKATRAALYVGCVTLTALTTVLAEDCADRELKACLIDCVRSQQVGEPVEESGPPR